VGSWSREDAIFPLVTRAHFCRVVMMWGGEASVRTSNFLVCMSGGSSIFACDEAYEF
jgi:hypothetical protein